MQKSFAKCPGNLDHAHFSASYIKITLFFLFGAQIPGRYFALKEKVRQ